MSASAVARNYAAALFELAGRDGSETRAGEFIDEIAGLYETDVRFQRFLNAPSVSPAEKKRVVREAIGPRAPEHFVRFLLVVLDRRRHRVLSGIARAYRDLLDEEAGRVRASITLPFEGGEEVKARIVEALERRFEKEIVPEFHTDARILGGMIVRVGDELLDASLRRQAEALRRELV